MYATVLGSFALLTRDGSSTILGQHSYLKSQKRQLSFSTLFPVGLPRKNSGTGPKQRLNSLLFTVSTVDLILSSSLSRSRPSAGTYLNSPLPLFTTHHPPTR